MPYLYGVSDQPLGFRLISLIERDWSLCVPTLWRCVDGASPRTEADAVLVNLGGGQYSAILSAGDTSGSYISYQLEAADCIADEKSICPLPSLPPGSGIVVEQYPGGMVVNPTALLSFNDASGFSVANLGSGQALIDLLDATALQRGLVSTGSQIIGGAKTFTDQIHGQQGAIFGANVNVQSGGLTLDIAGGLLITSTGYILREGSSGWLYIGNAHDGIRVRQSSLSPGGHGLDIASFGGIGSPVFSIDNTYIGQSGTSGGGDTVTGGILTALGSGPSSVAWGAITGTPTTFAGYGISTPIGVADGGLGASLAGTGPGALVQSSSGATVSVVAPGSSGNVLTSAGGVWTSAPSSGGSPLTTKGDLFGYDTGDARVPVGSNGDVLTADSTVSLGLKWAAPSGGSLAVGSPIGSGTAHRMLFENGSNNLAEDSGAIYNGSGNMVFDDGNFQPKMCDGSGAIHCGSAFGIAVYVSTYTEAFYAYGAVNAVKLVTSAYAVDAQTGSVNVLGTSGNTFRWNAGTSAPTPQGVIALPLSAFGAGTISQVLGTPDQWGKVNVAGTDYKVPMYL